MFLKNVRLKQKNNLQKFFFNSFLNEKVTQNNYYYRDIKAKIPYNFYHIIIYFYTSFPYYR